MNIYKCFRCNSVANKAVTGFFENSFFAVNCECCGAMGGHICGKCMTQTDYEKFRYCKVCDRNIKVDKLLENDRNQN
jgi:uncharacterized CHY-type Zn-finger protein